MSPGIIRNVVVAVVVSCVALPVLADRPLPISSGDITLSYSTDVANLSFEGTRPFLTDATGPGNSTHLDDAPNIAAFNSVNSFGRRTAVFNAGPQYAHVLPDNESLISHAFFKLVPAQLANDFFPGIVQDGDITITVENMQFDRPVDVEMDTFMLHALWNGGQADMVVPFYNDIHNHHTASQSFRDQSDFEDTAIIRTVPPNTDYGTVTPVFTGNGTDTLNLSITFPYSMLQHLEHDGNFVPDPLPDPQGFLEPFHFHLEYAVSPEPGSLALLMAGTVILWRRRS